MRISLARRSSRLSLRSCGQLLALLAAQQLLALAFIGFGLSHPLAQGLVVDAEVAGYVGDRAAGVEDHPGTAIEQLFGVFRLSWHGLIGSLPPGGILASRSPSNPAWLILLDDRLRPVAAGDLPPLVPVMPAEVIDGVLQHGPSQLFGLHKGEIEIRTYGGDELENAERILSVVASEVGLASFYELIQRAGSARRADRHREAVIDYGTAGELFVTAVLELVGRRRAMDSAKLSNLLNGPFRDRVSKLCRLLSVEPDPKNPECPLFYWWLHCYSQRNEIVHRGADSMEIYSEMARIGMVQMVVDIREAIRADPAIADIATKINWGRRVDETGGGSGSEPDPPPPM